MKSFLPLILIILSVIPIGGRNLYLCGSDINGKVWSLAEPDALMTETSPGIYEWTGESLGYSFKINEGSWDNYYNIGGNGNFLKLDQRYYYYNNSDENIKIKEAPILNPKVILNLNSEYIIVSGTPSDGEKEEDINKGPYGDIYIIGDNIGGKSWSLKEPDAKFNFVGNGKYEWYGDYIEGKFKLNDGTWDNREVNGIVMNFGTDYGAGPISPGIPFYLTAWENSQDIQLPRAIENPYIVFDTNRMCITLTQNVIIDDKARTINVNLNNISDYKDFIGMWLELTNQETGQQIHYVITEKTKYSFSNIPANTIWKLTIRNQEGDVFAEINNIAVGKNEVNVSFSSIKRPQDVSLAVFTPGGENVTKEVKITWNDENGNYISQAGSLKKMLPGKKVYYNISMPKELAFLYLNSEDNEYIVEETDNSLVCVLTPIKEIEFSGKIIDQTTQRAVKGAVVSASQIFGGKYQKTTTAKTDKSGNYNFKLANVPTRLTYSQEGYVTQNLDCDLLMTDDIITLEDINLKPISGSVISLKFNYIPISANENQSELNNVYNDFKNIDFSIFNNTKQQEIKDYNYQYPLLILLDGVEEGDEIDLTARSTISAFMPLKTSVNINSDLSGDAVFNIMEFGQIVASFDESDNDVTIGSLYDSKKKLIKSYDFNRDKLKITDLEDGKYYLVCMGKSSLFSAIYDLSLIAETGLEEGKDFLIKEIDVESGKISEVQFEKIPLFNEKNRYYTGTSTVFNVNKPSITIGNYLTFTGAVDFKDLYKSEVSDVVLKVDLPENCSFINNSVMVGTSMGSYNIEGNNLAIPLTDYSERVRFCMVPVSQGNYQPNAFVEFTLQGERIKQPIGSARFTAKDLSIIVPSNTINASIIVGGSVGEPSEIEIFDGNTLIGRTSTIGNGSWSATCELDDPYNLSLHSIHANVKTASGMDLKTETKECRIDKNAILVSKVTMYHYNPEMKKTYTSEFDFINPKVSPTNWIIYYPAKKFTYTIEFTKNDPELISNVILYVHTSDGNTIPLEAKYDEAQGLWCASADMGSASNGYYPVNCSVDFYCDTEVVGDSNRIKEIVSSCNEVVREDETLNSLLADIDLSEPYDPQKFEKLFAYLEIPMNDNTITSEEIDEFLDSLNAGTEPDWIEPDLSNGEFQFYDQDNMPFDLHCSYNENIVLTDNELESYTLTALDNGTKLYQKIEDGIVEIYYDNTLIKFGIENQELESTRAGKDEIYEDIEAKYNRAVEIAEKVGDFLTKFEPFVVRLLAFYEYRLGWCRDVQMLYNLNLLSPEQLEKLNFDKLNKGLKTYSANVNKVNSCLDKFKFLNGAFLIRDFITAKESMDEWNEIIDNINGSQCPNMDILAAEAEKYRNKAGAGYLFNLSVQLASLGGLDKLVGGFIASSVGVALGTASASLIVGCVSAFISDVLIIQGGINQINDIKWKGLIRSKIPGIKCADLPYLYVIMSKKEGSIASGNPDDVVIIDPSGYVYEAVPSNRIEGVTATIYYKEEVEDMYGDIHEEIVKWDAEAYAQENPLFTDENGMYAWDVPQGLWQVKFEKEGYETAFSEWLPVPPPQLDVNIGMKRSIQPNVMSAHAYNEAVEIKFDNYMLPETLNPDNIQVEVNGTNVAGTIQLMDEETSHDTGNESFASRLRFIPSSPFEGTEVTLRINNNVKSYSKVNMQDNYSESFRIEPEIKTIVCDSVVKIGYGELDHITVKVLPAIASAGKILQAVSSTEMILSLEENEIVINEEGIAEIPVVGVLPGSAALLYTIDGYDLAGVTVVNVMEMEEMTVSAPKASLPTGTPVSKGTEIILYCDTPGATIYYTLDGSCPCDQNRIEYTAPIVINENVTIKAMAVAPDLKDSEIVEFTYILDLDGIHQPGYNSEIIISPLPVRNILNVSAGDAVIKNVSVYTLSGAALISVSQNSTDISVDLTGIPKGYYVVRVLTEEMNYSKKILKIE